MTDFATFTFTDHAGRMCPALSAAQIEPPMIPNTPSSTRLVADPRRQPDRHVSSRPRSRPNKLFITVGAKVPQLDVFFGMTDEYAWGQHRIVDDPAIEVEHYNVVGLFAGWAPVEGISRLPGSMPGSTTCSTNSTSVSLPWKMRPAATTASPSVERRAVALAVSAIDIADGAVAIHNHAGRMRDVDGVNPQPVI